MDIYFRCFKCGVRYLFEHSNTRIYGPVIHTTCPFCKKRMRMNLSKFIERQIDTSKLTRFEVVKAVSEYAPQLEKKIR